MRQEAVLLGLVEAVDLIHEQKRPLPVLPPDPGLLEHLAQFRHTRENRTDLHKA